MSKDKEVRIKILDIHAAATNGESHSAYILSVEGKYRATFRFESDLNHFLKWLETELQAKLVYEVPYNMSAGMRG